MDTQVKLDALPPKLRQVMLDAASKVRMDSVRNDNTTLAVAGELTNYDKAFREAKTANIESGFLPTVYLGRGENAYSWTVYANSDGSQEAADGAVLSAVSALTGTEVSMNVYNCRDSFNILDQEVELSLTVQRPLSMAGVMGAKKHLDLRADRYFMIGNGTVKGLLNLAGTTTGTIAADGSGSSARWFDPTTMAAVKTPEQILRDCTAAIRLVEKTSEGKQVANTLVMPATHLQYIQSTKFAVGHVESILDMAKRYFPDVTFRGTYFMNETPVTVTTDAGKLSNRLVAAEVSEETLGRLVGMAPSIEDTERLNLATKFQVKCRVGGCVCRYLQSVAISTAASGGI